MKTLCLDVTAESRTPVARRRAPVMSAAAEGGAECSRRAMLVAAGAMFVGLSAPESAHASSSLMAAKRSYFRYVPRIEEGINYYVLQMYPAVQEGDWDALAKAYLKTSVARAGSEKAANDIDPKQSILERNFFTPMRTWSNAFAEKGSSPKTRAMLGKEEAFEKAMTRLEKALKKKDADEAKAAWDQGKMAVNGYIETANYGLSRELRKIDMIPDDLADFKEYEKRPDTTF